MAPLAPQARFLGVEGVLRKCAGCANHALGATNTRPRRGGVPTHRADPLRYTAALSSLTARNATFLLALILMAWPVAGLRPMRAGRLRTCRMPRPFSLTRLPFFRCLAITATMSMRMALA